VNDSERAEFDAFVEQALQRVPFAITLLLQETPLTVEDRPDDHTLEVFGLASNEADSICGLHTGVPITERSVDDPAEMPETITIYREGIRALVGNNDAEQIENEILITILHEVGHHYGLSEDDLDALGFG
jgi:predicted Zn-dependent protease with MMP-like domain